MSTTSAPFLSIVIPAFNEADRLPRALHAIRDYVDTRAFEAEVVLVDDGSSDKTLSIGRAFAEEWSRLRVVEHASNRGKGAAVRTGMLATRGRVVAFTDVDLAVPIQTLDVLVASLAHADAAISSRGLPDARLLRRESRLRETVGRLYAVIAQLLLLRGVPDAHCGLKVYRGDVARSVFAEVREDGILFDMEALCLMTERGHPIHQQAVTWSHDPASRIGINMSTIPYVIGALIRIKQRHAIPFRLTVVAPRSSALGDDLHVTEPHGYPQAEQSARIEVDPSPVVRRSLEHS